MADFNALQAIINAYIKRNGVQAITGQILNGVLTGMVNALGKGYTVAGAASPTTDPGTMTGPLAYIAYTAGTYTHFDNIVVEQGEVSMLIYNEAEWHKEVLFSLAAQATVDDNIGVPSVGVSFVDGILTFNFRNMKGEPGENGQDGDPAGFGAISASISGGVGTPGVSVQSSGPDTAKNIAFQFTNLKGETGVTSCVVTVDNTTGNPSCAVSLVGQELHLDFSGLKGAQGNTGSSVDYPFTIVNNLTTDDPTQALSAAMGVQLESEVSQLEAKLYDKDSFYINNGDTLDNYNSYNQDVLSDIAFYIDSENQVEENCTLESIKLYCSAAGNVQVYVIDSSYTIKFISESIQVTAGLNTIPLSYDLAVGDNVAVMGVKSYYGNASTLPGANIGNIIRLRGTFAVGQTLSVYGSGVPNSTMSLWLYAYTQVSKFTELENKDIEQDERIAELEQDIKVKIYSILREDSLELYQLFQYEILSSVAYYIDEKNAVQTDCILEKVHILAKASGAVDIAVIDSSYRVKKVYSGVSVVSGLNTIPVQFNMTAGDNVIVYGVNMFYASSSTFPIPTTTDIIRVNGTLSEGSQLSVYGSATADSQISLWVEISVYDDSQLVTENSLVEKISTIPGYAVKTKKLALLGDSWTAAQNMVDDDNTTYIGNYVKIVKDKLNFASVMSYAVSGAAYTHTANTILDLSGNAQNEDTNVIWNQINRLKADVDNEVISSPDIVYMMADTNDAAVYNRPLGTLADAFATQDISNLAPGDLTNFALALRFDLEYIIATFPDAIILVGTPAAFHGNPAKDWNDMTQAVCEKMGIKCLRNDLTSGLPLGYFTGRNRFSELFERNGLDIHLCQRGATHLGENIAAFLFPYCI